MRPVEGSARNGPVLGQAIQETRVAEDGVWLSEDAGLLLPRNPDRSERSGNRHFGRGDAGCGGPHFKAGPLKSRRSIGVGDGDVDAVGAGLVRQDVAAGPRCRSDQVYRGDGRGIAEPQVCAVVARKQRRRGLDRGIHQSGRQDAGVVRGDWSQPRESRIGCQPQFIEARKGWTEADGAPIQHI